MDINEFCEHIKLSVQTKRYKINAKYKNLRMKTFFLGKLYNKYYKNFTFESKNIVNCFKSQYVEMIVPKKLSSSKLNGLQWILPKLEQDNMLKVPETNYIYK